MTTPADRASGSSDDRFSMDDDMLMDELLEGLPGGSGLDDVPMYPLPDEPGAHISPAATCTGAPCVVDPGRGQIRSGELPPSLPLDFPGDDFLLPEPSRLTCIGPFTSDTAVAGHDPAPATTRKRACPGGDEGLLEGWWVPPTGALGADALPAQEAKGLGADEIDERLGKARATPGTYDTMANELSRAGCSVAAVFEHGFHFFSKRKNGTRPLTWKRLCKVPKPGKRSILVQLIGMVHAAYTNPGTALTHHETVGMWELTGYDLVLHVLQQVVTACGGDCPDPASLLPWELRFPDEYVAGVQPSHFAGLWCPDCGKPVGFRICRPCNENARRRKRRRTAAAAAAPAAPDE